MAGAKGRSGGRRAGAGAPTGLKPKTIAAIEENKIQQQIDAAVATALKSRDRDSKKKATTVLEEFMLLYAGMAAVYQPAAPGQPETPTQDPEKFHFCAGRTLDFAGELAQYQSPKFKAIAVAASMPMPAPDQTEPVPGGGKVIDINDPVRLAQVYRRVIGGARATR